MSLPLILSSVSPSHTVVAAAVGSFSLELFPPSRTMWELAGGLLTVGLVWFLRGALTRRTQELVDSREWQRLLFDHTSVAIIEEDFTAVGRRLEEFRKEGVTDLRAHLQAHPELVLALFRSIRITAANRTALATMRAKDTEELAAKIFGLANKRGPSTFPLELDTLWNGRSALTCETSFQVAPGERRRCILQWTVSIRNGVQDLSRVLLIFTDFTELHLTEERYRSLFDGAVEGVYETRASGGFRRANPELAKIFGYDNPSDLIALSPEDCRKIYVSPSRRDEFMAALSTGDVITDFESEVRRRDGSTLWISENVRAIRDSSGQTISFQGFVTDITARKNAQAALHESEIRYRTLFDQAPVSILEFDFSRIKPWFDELRAAGITDLSRHLADTPELRSQALEFVPLVGLNEATVRAFGGASKADVIARIAEISTSESKEARLLHIVTLWEGGNQSEGEMPLRMLDGQVRQFFYRWWMPLVEGRPKFGRGQMVLLDITTIRDAEQALRTSEARYRLLFENSPIGIVEFDFRPVEAWMERLRAAGVTDFAAYLESDPQEHAETMREISLVGVNAAAVRLFGAASKHDVLKNFSQMFADQTGAGRRQTLVAMWSGRNEFKAEDVIKALDGNPRRVHTQWWVPIVDGKPHYARTQLALLDLTQTKAAERALAAERERLSVTLTAMAEGVITTDPEGCIRFINEAACEIVGWTAPAAIGRPFAEVCTLRHEKTFEKVTPPITGPLMSDKPVDLPPHTVVMQRTGTQRLVEGRCAPMHDTSGQSIGVVLVLRDITERSKLEAELSRASKLESVGLLAGGIAHDFNNLLAIVIGNLAVAQLDQQVAASAGRWLKEAERGAMRARDLTQQLLTFAKGGEPIRSAVLLPEVVKEAAEFALHGSNVRAEFDIAPDLWAADADKGQFAQVVQNLALNAVQAMSSGGILKIAIRNETVAPGALAPLTGGRYLKMSITDAGPGIRPEHLARIFEPYFTTKQRGSGLGLATVYSILKRHHGHVEVESELGKGTTFHLWLPAARTTPAAPRPSQSPFAPMSGRVLFMDDEEGIRELAKELLTRTGLSVTAVADGAAVLREYEAARTSGKPFDLVIMDLTVPGGMGGREAMEKLLVLDPKVRAIVSSGYSSDPVLANYQAHGFRGMVPKPYRIADLTRTLREVLAAS